MTIMTHDNKMIHVIDKYDTYNKKISINIILRIERSDNIIKIYFIIFERNCKIS